MEGKIISAGGHFGAQKAFHQGTPDGTLFLYVLSKNFVQPEHFCPDGADRSRGMWYSTMWLMYSNRMV